MSARTTPQECAFTVDGLTYAGLRWGEPGQPLAIGLHGWLDNALSFSALGPLLRHCQVLALDLSGHGLSSHRSIDATYQIWDDVPQLMGIIDQLEADPVIVIGHSRGAAIATLLASVLADRCSHLVLIDGLLPGTPEPDDAPVQLRRFVNERRKYLARPARTFDTIDDFISKRASYGFTRENGATLAPRALEPTPNGFRLRSDARLFGASAMKLDRDDCEAFYAGVTAPTLGIYGDSGFFSKEGALELIEEAGRCIADYRSTILPGSHHLHLESCANNVAVRIDSFLASGI